MLQASDKINSDVDAHKLEKSFIHRMEQTITFNESVYPSSVEFDGMNDESGLFGAETSPSDNNASLSYANRHVSC